MYRKMDPITNSYKMFYITLEAYFKLYTFKLVNSIHLNKFSTRISTSNFSTVQGLLICPRSNIEITNFSTEYYNYYQ